jgi:hypothetical protein
MVLTTTGKGELVVDNGNVIIVLGQVDKGWGKRHGMGHGVYYIFGLLRCLDLLKYPLEGVIS